MQCVSFEWCVKHQASLSVLFCSRPVSHAVCHLNGVSNIRLLCLSSFAAGLYPTQCVSIISDICRSAEAVFDHQQHFDAQAEAEEQLLEYKHLMQQVSDGLIAGMNAFDAAGK